MPVPSLEDAMRAAGFSPKEDLVMAPEVTWTSLGEAFKREGFPPKWVSEFMGPMIDSGLTPTFFARFPREMGDLLRSGKLKVTADDLLLTQSAVEALGPDVVEPEDDPPRGPGDDPPDGRAQWEAA